MGSDLYFQRGESNAWERNNLRQQIATLEAALRFYANSANYWKNDSAEPSLIDKDGGDKAQAALKRKAELAKKSWSDTWK